MKTYVVCKVFNFIENVWKIKSVESIECYERKSITKEKLLERIDEINNNKFHWSLIDVEDNISEILDFMVGERQYKRYKEIDEICQDFESGIEEVRLVGEDISDLAYQFDNLSSKLKETMSKLKEISEKN